MSHIPLRYQGFFSLSLWAAATILLLRRDLFSLEEGGSKALLLGWSMADQVAASVVTFGAPDLRALLFLPVAFLFTGQVFAAKVLTIFLTALSIWLLYLWNRRNFNSESALIASGLLIISPSVLEHIDSLAPGIYLLAAFTCGAWLNKEYRSNPRPGGGWYFCQLLLSAFCVSLHPIGLAYPLSLLWSWLKDPLDSRQQKFFLIGISAISLFTLLLLQGWHHVHWFQNPVSSLAITVLGSPLQEQPVASSSWITGGLLLISLVLVIVFQFRAIWSDFTGRMLLVGLAVGATSSDSAWGIIALCLLLYYGTPLLLQFHHLGSGKNFLQQRGLILLTVIILSALFMRADRKHYEIRQLGILSGEDQLIRVISDEAEIARKIAENGKGKRTAPHFRVASQWPSRTMIACRCDTLPLPPVAKDPEAQLAMMSSITHLLFNPRQADNAPLARNLAVHGGDVIETIALLPDGVLLHFRNAVIPTRP